MTSSPADADETIVEIKIANHDAVGESRQFRGGLLIATKDSRRHIGLANTSGNATRYLRGLAGIGTLGAAESVN
jgi:hypothetical protein